MRGFNYKKAVQALTFLAKKHGGSLNKMKAIKLIWLSDRWHIRKYGRSITGDEYFAMQNGLVPSATRDILESSNFLDDTASDYASEYITQIDKYNYKTLLEPNLKVFSKTDLDALEIIFENFGRLDHFTLSEFSHQFPEWKKYESALLKKVSSRFSVNQLDFFINIAESSGIYNDSEDILSTTKKMFEDNLSLQAIF